MNILETTQNEAIRTFLTQRVCIPNLRLPSLAPLVVLSLPLCTRDSGCAVVIRVPSMRLTALYAACRVLLHPETYVHTCTYTVAQCRTHTPADSCLHMAISIFIFM